MANLNKVMLMGNLTRDPILKALPSGMSVCEMGLAINRYYRTPQGEDKKEVCFVDIECYGRTADNCNRYLRKGSGAYFEGRLKQDKWIDKSSGQNRSKLMMVADKVQFLDAPQPGVQGNSYGTGREGVPAFGGYAPTTGAYSPPVPGVVAEQNTSSELPPVEIYEDEIIEEEDNVPF
ncbi:MAG: single-stranded DNA-binding protein [Oligosphaeraceae bacterium]|nr:single-stranded DNA-binding protein [Oligosphaeraceae bacterium]